MERDSAERFELNEEEVAERLQRLKERAEDVQVRHKQLKRKEFMQFKREMEAFHRGPRPMPEVVWFGQIVTYLKVQWIKHFRKNHEVWRL